MEDPEPEVILVEKRPETRDERDDGVGTKGPQISKGSDAMITAADQIIIRLTRAEERVTIETREK